MTGVAMHSDLLRLLVRVVLLEGVQWRIGYAIYEPRNSAANSCE